MLEKNKETENHNNKLDNNVSMDLIHENRFHNHNNLPQIDASIHFNSNNHSQNFKTEKENEVHSGNNNLFYYPDGDYDKNNKFLDKIDENDESVNKKSQSLDNMRLFNCEYPSCGKSYNRISRLHIHMRTHVNITVKKDRCETLYM